MKKKKPKVIKGLLWCGYATECKDKVPCYIIKTKGGEGFFPCDTLRKYAGKKIKITIEGVK